MRPVLAEKVFGFFEEALADGIDVFVARVGEFLELGFLRRAEFGGDLHSNTDVEVSPAVPLDVFYALALQAKDIAGLGAGRNFDLGRAVEGGHLDFSAEGSLDEADRDFANQIVTVPGKNLMGLYMEDNVKIARGTPASAGFAITGGAQARAGVHARRDSEFDFARPFAPARTPALAARIFDRAPRAFATGAGLSDAEDPAGGDDLATATAGGTGFGL